MSARGLNAGSSLAARRSWLRLAIAIALSAVALLGFSSCREDSEQPLVTSSSPGANNLQQLRQALTSNDNRRFCQALAASSRQALINSSSSQAGCPQALAASPQRQQWRQLLAAAEFVGQRRRGEKTIVVFVRQQPVRELSSYPLRWEKGAWRAEIIATN